MTIGQRIKEARERRDMTLDEVAKCCNTRNQREVDCRSQQVFVGS